MGRERFFRFKEFGVHHERSAMKVGVDGVLIGAWAKGPDAPPLRILDAGTGCGLIALICAQRFCHASVLGVDVDTPSIDEASSNFSNSPWAERLESRCADFMQMSRADFPLGFDMIISNPPFFDAGLTFGDNDARLRARHVGDFSPLSLISHGADMLSDRGVIALISPVDQLPEIETVVRESGLHMHRLCSVYGSPQAPPKRVMIELGRMPQPSVDITSLYIYTPQRDYTADYRSLTAPFYLNF